MAAGGTLILVRGHLKPLERDKSFIRGFSKRQTTFEKAAGQIQCETSIEFAHMTGI
jgi:hypothetical protein